MLGRTLRRATPDEAAAAVFGYTCANDVTARDLQRRDGQWSRAKGFDTFLPLGPAIATDLDVADVRVVCRVDGVGPPGRHDRATWSSTCPTCSPTSPRS